MKEPLISLPATEIISRLFQKGLKRLGVEWPLAIEASSLEVIARYVANGDGIGVTVSLPGAVRHPGVRMLALEGFEPLDVRAYWHGQLTPLIRAVLEEGQRYVRQSWPEWQVDDTLPEPPESRTGG